MFPFPLGRRAKGEGNLDINTLNGIPDVNVCDHGAHYWLELKSNDLKNCGLSKWQINWHCDRIKSGGYVFILNRTLVPRALKLLAVDPVSRAPFLVSRFKDNEEGMRSILEDAASRAREPRFSFLVDRS